MKLEDQVASPELCKRLKELGCHQESLYCWGVDGDIQWCVFPNNPNGSDFPSAFTVAELGEMLPEYYGSDWSEALGWCCGNMNETVRDSSPPQHAKKEADARAKAIIRLIEKGIIKP